ncbi:MAG: conjugal transfer protein TraN [Gammaproteobacteria bacterium]|nr:conjugal transfer protein TraN [Gammaproteobacteria bacterium]MDH5651261.1 conjugal transfer protein TraN [Gammaproteobacteria bacterium]
MRSLASFLLLILYTSHGLTQTISVTDALAEGQSFGSSSLQQSPSLATDQNPNSVPGFQGTNIPETQLSTDPLSLENAARTQVNQNDAGTFVNDSLSSRPQFSFDQQTDPLLTRSANIEAAPQSVAGSITGEFTGCSSTTTTTPAQYNTQTCVEWRQSQSATCEESLAISCKRPIECDTGGILLSSLNSDMQWNYTYPILTLGASGDNIWSGWCAIYDRRTTFTIEDINKVKEFTLIQAGFDDWIRISVNGSVVYVGPYGGDRLLVNRDLSFFPVVEYGDGFYGSCELRTNWVKNLNIDIKPYLRTGTNTIDMRVVVAGFGEGWMKFRASQYCDCEWSETWQSNCADLETQLAAGLCTSPKLTCLEPAETRTIDGIDVYRDCWRYEKQFECAAPSTVEEDYCAVLRNQGCTQIGSQCTGTLPNGLCESFEQTYQCETAPGVTQNIVNCSGQTLCLDGGCFDTSYAPSTDFGIAAGNLGAISEAGADFDPNGNIIFSGEDLRCSKAILGFSNCCKLDGWGQDLSLDQCTADEQRLALARQAGLCHYVGSYCSNSTFFGCVSRTETHCCFKSKLGRIIQEQGRVQLGLDWGIPQAPKCDGLTVVQLHALDFSQIDFSEFYADAYANAIGPNSTDLQNIIQNYIQQSLP